MNKVVDDQEDEEIIRRICCSVKTFFISNCCWGFFSICLLAVGLVGLLLPATPLEVLPGPVYIVAISFAGFSLLVIFLGCLGTLQRVELCFILYIFFASLALLGQIVCFAFLILYTNDLGGIVDQRGGIINGDDTLRNTLISLSEDADDWKDFQDSLDCCGISFDIDETVNDVTLIETGDACDPSILEDVNDARGDDNIRGNEEENNAVFGIKEDFFCESAISNLSKTLLPVIATVVGLYIITQLFALVSAGRMYWVPEFLGGWALDEEAMTEIAKTKGIELKVPEGGYNGNRVLSTIRSAGNRLSYRLQNAVTADPNVPASAGFLKRLSTNRAVSFVGAAPQAQPADGSENQQGGGGRAVSMRSMLSVFSSKSKSSQAPKSFIDANQMGVSTRSNNAAPPGMSYKSVTSSKLLEVSNDNDEPPRGTQVTQDSLQI